MRRIGIGNISLILKKLLEFLVVKFLYIFSYTEAEKGVELTCPVLPVNTFKSKK